jgi:hypothetical protein
MTVTYSDVIDIAPELATIEAARINRFISRAALSVNSAVFGNKADLATTYLTAHMLSTGGSRSLISEEKVGNLSRKYARTPGEADLESTPYGKAFKRLRREVVKPFTITQSGSFDR